MAVEIELQIYVFERSPNREPCVTSSVAATTKRNCHSTKNARKPDQSAPRGWTSTPLRYNPLHDLESIWWIAAFFLYKRDVLIDDADTDRLLEQRRQKEQHQDAETIFSINRSTLLSDYPAFPRLLGSLHPSVQPIGRRLEDLRKKLVATYRSAEEDPSTITHTVADGLYARFKREFSEIAADLRKKPVEVEHFPLVLSPGRKRPRENFTPEYSPCRPHKKARILEPPSPRITRARAAVLAERNS